MSLEKSLNHSKYIFWFLVLFIWIIATFITPPDDEETLKNFVKKVNPGGPGWKKFYKIL